MDNSSFNNYRQGDYQRTNFDAFLKHINFNYIVPSIHITGTNGKGSTAEYIYASYMENGYKVGIFSSPSLSDVNQMIRINHQAISDEEINGIINRYQKEIKKFDLSAFEVQAFIAFTYFMESHCDIAVIECGMGGLMDATNVFTPILSIITTISIEHTDYLGYSLSEVAEHKAGIIKENVPVLIQEFDEDALNVVLKTVKEDKAQVYYINRFVEQTLTDQGYSFIYTLFGEVKLDSIASYSVTDACFALEAIKILQNQFPFDIAKVKEGISKVHMPGRMERITDNIVLDGGHNPEAISRLTKDIVRYSKGKTIHIVFACFRDKNLIGMLSSLGAISNDITLTTFNHPRARKEEEYFLFLDDYHYQDDAYQLIKDKANEYPNDIILVTGSLAFVGYIRKCFQIK